MPEFFLTAIIAENLAGFKESASLRILNEDQKSMVLKTVARKAGMRVEAMSRSP